MKKYIFVGLGGLFGTYFRYFIRNIHLFSGNIPFNTLIVNVTGSFFLAVMLTIAFEIRKFDINIKLGVVVGFCGAFTTFSTFCKEAVVLFNDGNYLSATFYVVFSIVLGLAAVYIGNISTRKIIYGYIKIKNERVAK